VKGDGKTTAELRTLEDWVVERALRQVPGVADVVAMGGFIKQYEVQPDLDKLRAYKLSFQSVLEALGRGNSNAGGSYVTQGTQQFAIRGIGLLRSPEEIGQIVVSSRNGTPILIRDIAQIKVGAVPRLGTVGQDLDDDIVTGIVVMRKGENPSSVLKGVKQKIADLNARGLPAGVQIVPFYDRTWLMGKTLTTVFKNLVEGALLVALVLYLFLSNMRASLAVVVIIPLALLSTFLGLKIMGVPANLLSLGAMDFGIIVDGAVIVVENIMHRLAQNKEDMSENERREVIINATNEVGRPTLFSMLIIIAAHIPIFALQRHEGRIFQPMALSVTTALVGSLVFAATPNCASSITSWNPPAVNSVSFETAAGWRRSDLGDMTMSGFCTSRSTWRRRAWKKLAGVVMLATWILSSAQSWRKRSKRAEECSGPWPS
jgi:cobalt-zinc-cadmium resistance protein CzcA